MLYSDILIRVNSGCLKVSKYRIDSFKCPVCNDNTLVSLEIDEKTFNEAKRFPMMITVKCPHKHDLVAFVDQEKKVRDVETAVSAKQKEKDVMDKTRDYFESF